MLGVGSTYLGTDGNPIQGYLGIGHNITVLVHAIEPSGTGFYKYVSPYACSPDRC